uniref:Wbp11/ELF5/Saf1 N-terminal domain-containing protein n=1 Tax=Strigamia maritima TaxID=126957 RepID=T1IZT6_STRMM
MGKRSSNTTKGGKFMNPTDRARKEARKKELKKNKNKRQLVRVAALKGTDAKQVISEMEKIDQMEFDVNKPPQLNGNVLDEKRRKLYESFRRVLRYYEKEDRSQWTELKRMEMDYNRRRGELKQFFESVKHAQQVQIDDIPLPDLPFTDCSRIPIPSIPIPPPPPVIQSISKKPQLYRNKAPGVPPGPPPDFSDSEDDVETMEVLENITQHGPTKQKQLLNVINPWERIVARPGGPPGPPPGLPPGISGPPRCVPFHISGPLLHIPPPQSVTNVMGPPGLPMNSMSSVLSAPPSLISRPASQEKKKKVVTTIQAKPQIKNLVANATRFMPTSLVVKREEKRRKEPMKSMSTTGLKDPLMLMTVGSRKPLVPPLPTSDAAYAQFMKEMNNILG